MSTNADGSENINSDDMFKILIATDIHLGYNYNKKRGNELDDSFVAFEEILQHARSNEVDFILLGGDLFHDTKPSQTVLLKCTELLRKYCLGLREIKVKFLSDPEVVFKHCTYKTVNYEDPNLNISMPVFSIHGNHDDPSFGATGSMDLLSTSGLINYFGKWMDLTKVVIPPLILKKGSTHIAIYGLSYINNQRLSRLLRDDKVDFLRPTEIPDCFNILVLHQNRAQHSEYGHIPENSLPKFLNLIVWGHEHECRIMPEFVPHAEYFITQPGSSVATSLSESEAKPKHVGVLSIIGSKFKMKKLKLKTVRPFVFDNLILKDEDIPTSLSHASTMDVYNFVDQYIEHKLIPKASLQLTSHPKQPIQPLIRLRILYSKPAEVFDTIKLAQKYCDEVANPMDMIIFRKVKASYKRSDLDLSSINDDLEDIAQALCHDSDADWKKTVQDQIKMLFSLDEHKDKLSILTVNGLNEALNRCINRGDPDAFKDIVNHQMKKTISYLEDSNVDTSNESISKEIKSFRDQRLEKHQEDQLEIQELFNDAQLQNRKAAKSVLRTDIVDVISSDEDEQSDAAPAAKAARGRGRGRGRGSRGGARGKSKKETETSPLDVTTISRSSGVAKQTKKLAQNTLQSCIGTSSQNQPRGKICFIDDSD
ncbi:double strand break repair nuclease mre11 [Andrena cerasifolii]|uniref:double strand break repair nuclease mre11 n=1 Tax=Andrena cerasifolii TaxID=2819439 RepID=UPI004037EF78